MSGMCHFQFKSQQNTSRHSNNHVAVRSVLPLLVRLTCRKQVLGLHTACAEGRPLSSRHVCQFSVRSLSPTKSRANVPLIYESCCGGSLDGLCARQSSGLALLLRYRDECVRGTSVLTALSRHSAAIWSWALPYHHQPRPVTSWVPSCGGGGGGLLASSAISHCCGPILFLCFLSGSNVLVSYTPSIGKPGQEAWPNSV